MTLPYSTLKMWYWEPLMMCFRALFIVLTFTIRQKNLGTSTLPYPILPYPHHLPQSYERDCKFGTPYPTLPCPTTHCPTLHCTALHCLTLPALHYPTLSYPTLHCPALPYPTLPYTTLQCTALHCTALLSYHNIP